MTNIAKSEHHIMFFVKFTQEFLAYINYEHTAVLTMRVYTSSSYFYLLLRVDYLLTHWLVFIKLVSTEIYFSL